MTCPEHRDFCAYRGDEPDRCPWCHCLWTHILATRRHSCESGDMWTGRVRAWRVRQAVRMRREAAIEPDRGANTPRVDQGAT